MAEVDINTKPEMEDNSVTGTTSVKAARLLGTIVIALAQNDLNENNDSFPHESILHDYGTTIRMLTDPEGRQVEPESFIEMAEDIIERLKESNVTSADITENISIAEAAAKEAWENYWEDAFVPPQKDEDVVLEDIAKTISNSFDAEDIAGYYLIDADILEIAKGREVTTANLFNSDGSPDPNGAFSERIFGPIHGVSCDCGETKSGSENGSVTVGEICPECGTPTRSCAERKTTWGYALSPVPLVFGREEIIGAMIYGLLDDEYIHYGMESLKNPLEPKDIVESMAKGEQKYAWVYGPFDEDKINEDGRTNAENTEKKCVGKIITWEEALRRNNEKDNNGRPKYSVRGGIRGIEAALEYLDEHDNGKYVDGDKNSALYNAYDYCQQKMEHVEKINIEKDIDKSFTPATIKKAADALANAQATYNAVYAFINDRKARPSEMLLHAIPIPPPGMRPVNDRNGKTDLGDINEGIQRFLQATGSFLRLASQEGFGWIGTNVWQDNCQRIYEAETLYLNAVYSKIAGKTGLVRGRLKAARSDEMMMAVIVPDIMNNSLSRLNNGGLRDVLPTMITELPARGMRKMYEKEIRAVLKDAGKTPQEIKEALRVPVGTMVTDENGNRRRCDADLALEAVAAGYGSGKGRKGPNPEVGRLFVPEGNPFGVSRSQAREKYESIIRLRMKREGYSDEQIAEEFGKAPGTMENGEPCLVDRMLETMCMTEHGGLITALSRDPVIKTTGVQLAYVVPNFEGDVIKVHPLVMKGFDGDFDGDRLAAIRLVQDRAHEKAKNIMIQAFREDGTGSINHLPTLESLIGLYRMTQSYGDRPDYSLKYDGIIANAGALTRSGDIINEVAVNPIDITVHRILRELSPANNGETLFGGKDPSSMIGRHFAPGEAYGTSKNGTPLYSDKACYVTQADGKYYLVDSFSDTVRVPAGASVKDNGFIKAGEPVATAPLLRGTLKSIERELERGTITPMTRVILRNINSEDESYTERETTAGRAMVERLLPPGVTITGEQGISKKWISNMLNTYIEERSQALQSSMASHDAYMMASREAMEIADNLTEYGFGECSRYFGAGASFQDFHSFLPIDTTSLFRDGGVPYSLEGQAYYKKLAKEKGVEYYKYISDFNTSYLADIVGSGEKGVGIVEAVANRNVANTYSGGTLSVTGGNVVSGLFGYKQNIAEAESQRSNNKTEKVGDMGALRNLMDVVADGMLLEEGECGTSMYLEGPLTENNLKEYEGRLLARTISNDKGLDVEKDSPLTKELLKKIYTAGVRSIPYRSAITCRCQGVCEKCAGINPNVQAQTGDDIGHRAVAAVFQPLSQGIMDVAKKSMASDGKNDTGIEIVKSLFDGRSLSKRITSMNVEYMSNYEENKPFDRLGRIVMTRMNESGDGKQKSARDMDGVSMAHILADEIMDVADRKVPQVYAEIMAKRLIAAQPETSLSRTGTEDSRTAEKPMMSLTELVNYGLRGQKATEVLNPGVFLSQGGKDAAVDYVSKNKTTGLVNASIATAMANVTKGTTAQIVPPLKEEYRSVLKQESRNRANAAGRLYNQPVAKEIVRG